jgi:hypothetical protein
MFIATLYRWLNYDENKLFSNIYLRNVSWEEKYSLIFDTGILFIVRWIIIEINLTDTALSAAGFIGTSLQLLFSLTAVDLSISIEK